MKRKQNTMQLCIHLVLIFICILSLLPFLSMVSTSFMKVKGVLPDEPILLPRLPLYTQKYVKAWVSNHFQTYFVNTIVVSFGGVVFLCTFQISGQRVDVQPPFADHDDSRTVGHDLAVYGFKWAEAD